jgi:hypothetical protein
MRGLVPRGHVEPVFDRSKLVPYFTFEQSKMFTADVTRSNADADCCLFLDRRPFSGCRHSGLRFGSLEVVVEITKNWISQILLGLPCQGEVQAWMLIGNGTCLSRV